MPDRQVRVNVSLNQSEAAALIGMADAECRHPREQLRHILREEARRRGLLPPEPQEQPATNKSEVEHVAA